MGILAVVEIKAFVPARDLELAKRFYVDLVFAVARSSALAKGLIGTYSLRTEPHSDKPWGMRDFVLIDPSGVMWRIAQNIKSL